MKILYIGCRVRIARNLTPGGDDTLTGLEGVISNTGGKGAFLRHGRYMTAVWDWEVSCDNGRTACNLADELEPITPNFDFTTEQTEQFVHDFGRVTA